LGHGQTSTSKARAAKKFLLLVSGERQMDLNIGEKHVFEVRSPELEGISHPHRANAKALDSSDVVILYDILKEKSHQTVKEVFNNPKQFNEE